MILGMDHLALSVTDIDAAVAAGQPLGFDALFVERNLPNPECKRPLLIDHRAFHDVALLRAYGGGTAIEAVRHARRLAAPRSQIMPLLCGQRRSGAAFGGFNTAGPDWPAICRDALGVTAVMAEWAAWRAPLCLVNERAEPHVAALLVATPAWEKDLMFWRDGVSATIASHEPGRWALLKLKSPVAAWQGTVLLARTENAASNYLDSAGFPCIALWSSALAEDTDRLRKFGGSSIIEPFTLTVNGRVLTVIQLRAPGGWLLELIQLTRKTVAGQLALSS